MPSYAATSQTGGLDYTWSLASTDARALVDPGNPSSHLATTLYSQSFTIDVNLTDGNAHEVSLYLLDFDTSNVRSEHIEVIDPSTNRTLDMRTVSSFSNGLYLTWVVSGHVQFRVTNLATNTTSAVVSGLFFDPAAAGLAGPATFLQTDAKTSGSWLGGPAEVAGGAIENWGNATITESTVAASAASTDRASPGVGAGIDNASGATLSLYNDLITASTGGSDIANSGTLYGGNDLATTTSGVPASMLVAVPSGSSPAIRSLANNGGPLPTIGLQPTSAAIDAGDNAAAALPPSDTLGLVGWWRGEGNGGDSAGSDTAALQGGVSFAPGETGQAFVLNGSNADVVAPSTAALNASTFSTGGWFNLSAAPAAGSAFILTSKSDGSGDGWILSVNNALVPSFTLFKSTAQSVNATATHPIATGAWVYLAATYDGTTLRLYVGGVQAASATLAGGYSSSSTPLTIGAASWANLGDTSGLVDEYAFYNRALSAAEVQGLAANNSPTTDQRGLPRVANGTVDVGAFESQPYLVSNTNDSGPGSLRQAVMYDVSGDQPVVFAMGLAKQTITLTSGPIVVDHSLTIDGPGADQLTIGGGNAVEDFVVTSGTVVISGLTIANGSALQGGGIFNSGNLTLTNDAFLGNTARNSVFSGGNKVAQGGAIYNAPGASLVVTGSTFANNTDAAVSASGSDGRGGAIYNATGATLSATNDTFAANTATSQQGYGFDGFVVFGNLDARPSYAAVDVFQGSFYAWASSTSDPRALQKSAPTATDRIAATFSATTSEYLDVNINDGKSHRVSLYLLDFDTNNVRSERIDVIDATTGAVLDSETVSSFTGGKYLSWVVSGHVHFQITALTGNAVISGVFFDAAPAGTSGPATFLGTDTTTQGSWRGAASSMGDGGAIDNAGTASVSNSTFSGNSVGSGGDGSGLFNEAGASLSLFDSIVANGTGGHDVVNLGTTTGGSDLVTTSQGLPTGLVISTADPILGPLQNNGGPTPTMALGDGSPALDAGDPTNAPAFDQRGMPRITGAGIDLGAFESIGGPPSADAGDGYVIHQGDSVTFSAADSFDPAGVPLTYSWDINGDGVFGDATGVSPTLTPAQLSALGIRPRTAPYQVAVRVTNDDDTTTATPTTLTVLPALRIASVSTGAAVFVNTAIDAVTVTFTGPIDAATLDAGSVSLTRDGAVIPIVEPFQVRLVDGTTSTYQIQGLSALTQQGGTYVLTIDAGAVEDAAGSGTGTASVSWVMDTTAPVTRILPLAATQAGTSFDVSVATVSNAGAPTVPLAGIDLYVSTNNGPFVFWTSVSPSQPTADFQGQEETSYAFLSMARDAVGNREVPSSPAARTVVPDLTAPLTRVVSVNTSSPTFQVGVEGSDTGGSGLAGIDVFVQVDAGTPRLVAHVNGASGTISYPAIVDGSTHTYRIFTQGTDAAGNVEPAGASGAKVVQAAFEAVPTGYTVQGGAVGTSYVRDVDLAFGPTVDVASLVAGGHVHVTRRDFQGGNATPVSVAGLLHVLDHAIELDFGPGGVGGDPNSFAGDGTYEIEFDGSPTTYSFTRRLGDVNGDGVVNAADVKIVRRALHSKHYTLQGDVNGDGKVNRHDLALAKKAVARARPHGHVRRK